MTDRASSADVTDRVREALAEMEAALAEFQRAYLAWAEAGHLDKPLRKGLLSQAETRLLAAREALETLETRLAEAREDPP